MTIESIVQNETARCEAFPVCNSKIFLAHSAVTALPRIVADAVVNYTRECSESSQEFGEVLRRLKQAREAAARLIGATADEIAFLGPTAFGLNLFARGLDWHAGDEVICYAEDYPTNIYPWMELQHRGVTVKYLEPEVVGDITPELVAASLGPRTRLVALSSANFLTGQRIDVDAIGRLLHERGVLFSLDAIQTLGAFPLTVEHVDFLSAGAHKWQLGPIGSGFVYVKKEHFARLRPVLLGAMNVESPNFIAQDEIRFGETAARYESGALNFAGIFGLRAAHDFLMELGISNIAARILEVKGHLVKLLGGLGFDFYGPTDPARTSGITTFRHPEADMAELFRKLSMEGVVATFRHNRAGNAFIRLAPHFYNTIDELDRVASILNRGL
jgi:selenocysteine lyase/cysteine desulfurase